eukprot:3834603-Rhodomonas_salina.2
MRSHAANRPSPRRTRGLCARVRPYHIRLGHPALVVSHQIAVAPGCSTPPRTAGIQPLGTDQALLLRRAALV